METATVLFVLKMFGFGILILLGILGGLLVLLLFLLAILLFVPVRYRVNLQYEAGKFILEAKIHFLLRLIRVRVSFKEKLFYSVKIGFFTLLSSLKEKKEKKKKKEKKEKKKKNAKSAIADAEKEKEKKTEEEKEVEVGKAAELQKKLAEEKEFEASKYKETKNDEKKGATQTEDIPKADKEEAFEEEKDFFEKLEEKAEKVQEFSAGLYEKGKNLSEKTKDINTKKDYVLDFFRSDGTVDALKLFMTQSLRLVKAILPDKIEGRIRFGIGDVYTEGQYLTYLCLFYGFYADKLEIEPEWDEKVFETDLFLKGKIRLFTILRICIKVYFDSSFRKFRDNIDFLRTRLGI